MPYIKNTYNLQNDKKSQRFYSQKKRRSQAKARKTDGFLDQELATFNKGFDPFTITRRHFLYGAAGVAALIGAGAGVKLVTDNIKSKGSISTLSVPANSFKLSDDLAQVENTNRYRNLLELKLDLSSSKFL